MHVSICLKINKKDVRYAGYAAAGIRGHQENHPAWRDWGHPKIRHWGKGTVSLQYFNYTSDKTGTSLTGINQILELCVVYALG